MQTVRTILTRLASATLVAALFWVNQSKGRTLRRMGAATALCRGITGGIQSLALIQ